VDWEPLLGNALNSAQEAIQAEANTRETPVRDLATTLILVVAAPDRVSAIQVGDGAVVVGKRGGELIGLTKPQRGEYANETVFLTSDDMPDMAQVRVWDGPTHHVAMFTDGLEPSVLGMPDAVPHAPFFNPLFRFLEGVNDIHRAQEQLSTLLRSRRLAERTDDDVTLLVATLRW
jgi:hypothetical protein